MLGNIGSVSARAALERRSVQVPDVQADPEFAYAIRDVDPIRTVLAVPMLKGDDLVGAITIYRLEVKPFTDKQVTLLENFRRAGRHRHREHPPAQRIARIAPAADRHRRRAQGYQPVDLQFANRARYTG